MILGLKNNGQELEVNIIREGKLISFKKVLKKGERVDLLEQIKIIFKKHKIETKDIKKIAIFKGPGGFTALRACFSFVNTFSEFNKIPVVLTQGEKWFEQGIEKKGKTGIVMPDYGSEPSITIAKKL